MHGAPRILSGGIGIKVPKKMVMMINDHDNDDDDDVYQHEGSRARGRRFLSASLTEVGPVRRGLPVHYFQLSTFNF